MTHEDDDVFEGSFSDTLITGIVAIAAIIGIGWFFAWLLMGAIGPYL